MLSLAFLSISLLVIYITLLYIFRLLRDPLKEVPGPFVARFSGLWELWKTHQGSFHMTEQNLHKIYGPVVRLAPRKYSISSVDAVKTMYGPGSRFKKADYYHAFGNPDESAADMFSERDPERHAMKRRKVAALYTMTSLVSYEQAVNDVNATLERVMSEFSATKARFDLPMWMQFYAFDVIGEITVGKTFGYLEQGQDFNGIIHALHQNNQYACRVGLLPWLHPRLAAISSALKLPTPFDRLVVYINEQLKLAEDNPATTEGRNFLQKLMPLREEKKLSHFDVFSVIGANIAAGSETTATALSTLIYYITKNPPVLEKLRKEMDERKRANRFSDPVTFAEAQEMPYLQAVIKEGLRIHPATGAPLLRIVPEGGVTIADTFFPAGVEVGINPWALHFDSKIFGDTAYEFCPERWLGEREKRGHIETCFLTFGAGSRTCLGKNISMLEMSKVIPQLYRKFDFHLDPENPDWTVRTEWFTRQHFNCSISYRGKDKVL